jgi:hypothetical protein
VKIILAIWTTGIEGKRASTGRKGNRGIAKEDGEKEEIKRKMKE